MKSTLLSVLRPTEIFDASLRRLVIQLVHLPELAHPVLPHPVRHLAKDQRLVLIAEDILRYLDLQVVLLGSEVSEENV